MTDLLDKFQRRLNIRFEDIGLLRQALTHRSVSKKNNERLEFLGDSILGMVITEQLYRRYPDINEGGLSRFRSHLVRKETLAALATQYNFGDVLVLGAGELKSGGARHDSILADSFEAVLGAYFLDQGMVAADKFLINIYQDKLSALPSLEQLKDAKTRLQEWLQARKMAVPQYQVIKEKTDHPQEFEVSATIKELSIHVVATSSSRRKAEQQAAAKILEQIKNG